MKPVPADQQISGVAHVRGMAALALYSRIYLSNRIEALVDIHRRHGDAVFVHNPLHPGRPARRLLLFGPRYNKAVLSRSRSFRPNGIWPVKGPRGSAQANLRDNLLPMHGKRHAHFRRILEPHLKRARVGEQALETLRVTREELDAWPVGGSADVRELARRVLQRQVFNAQFAEHDRATVLELGRLIDLYHAYNWSWRALAVRYDIPGTGYHRLLRHAEKVQAAMLRWADGRRGDGPAADLRSALAGAQGMDGCPLREGEVAGNLAVLCWAAYETCASVLTWALILLAQHPAANARLLEELPDRPARTGGDVAALMRLPYLEAVINESMRLIAPVPAMGLVALHDTEIMDIPVRKSSTVILSPFVTHRLPEIYDAPREFRPERWADIRPSAYEFMPFSAGLRRCPGFWLGMANLKIALASIVRRYRFGIAPGARIDLHYMATTVPRQSVPLEVHAQDGRFAASRVAGNLAEFVRMPRPAA